MRYSNDEFRNGLLWNGFDYTNQAWVVDGRYVRCGHPENMNCSCFGKTYEGWASMQEGESWFPKQTTEHN
jgi:hypothetical protein